jgi:hypothetical protein
MPLIPAGISYEKAFAVFDYFSAVHPEQIEKYKSRLAWGFDLKTVECANLGGLLFFATTDAVNGKRSYTIRCAALLENMTIASFHLPEGHKVGAFPTRAKAESAYKRTTSEFIRYVFDGENIKTLVGLGPAPQLPESMRPERPKKPSEMTPEERWKETMRQNPDLRPVNDPRDRKYQFLSIGGKERAAKAVVKVKQGEFTHIGEVCEYLDRLQVKEQPPELEDLFKNYFFHQTGKELSEFIEC